MVIIVNNSQVYDTKTKHKMKSKFLIQFTAIVPIALKVNLKNPLKQGYKQLDPGSIKT